HRSAVIAVLDDSPGARFNIISLLDDLAGFDGEVIVVFNGPAMFEALKDHPRIDKWSLNRHNVGVGRAWNIGLNQAEGAVVFVLNADLHVTPAALLEIECQLLTLPEAVIVGVGGDLLDLRTLQPTLIRQRQEVTQPMPVDRVSGYLLALHAQRFHDAGMSFDPRFSPYFHEETDIALQARAHGLKLYAVPAAGVEHDYGISCRDRPILWFGRPVETHRMQVENGLLLLEKWRRHAGL
ncbi:MAG: glycosyltransferase, partial [Rhodospirillales bacterium]|nr:glycosyltransferase [Rhodospirillales bacterium]